jgi:hypothetical protein
VEARGVVACLEVAATAEEKTMRYLIAGLLALGWVAAFVPVAGAQGDHALPLESEGAGKEGKGKKKALSDAQVRQILIDESIAVYSGNCPCPYSTARNGSRCGKRSAYSREGGEAPLCYPKDVSQEMVQQYREAHAEE